jgi:sugar O-acyltransferase (sialic acid O-acetyltransferase NeuD family)
MENKNLILVGGGGHCKSVIDVAESAGYTIKGILDLPEKVGEKILGYPIMGTDKDISEFVHEVLFLVTVGQIKDASLRINLHQKIVNAGGKLATVIAATAHVSNYAKIGEGTVVMHQAMVNADAVIGKSCIINTFANIEHDVVIGDYCHISTGAIINGNCKIGRGTFFGSQSVMVNGLEIAEECIIGAGSVVSKDLKQKGIYWGNPALLKIKL